MHETNSLEATDYYGVTKIAGELLVRAFVSRTDKPIVNVRPFSVYGKGEADFRFIPTAVRCVKFNQPMKLAHGMHDWINITDFVDGLKYVMENAKEMRGRAVNIGTSIETDNYEVVRTLAMIAKKDMEKLPIEYIPNLRSRDHWVADNTLLKSLGWTYKIPLREGLHDIYESITA